MSPGMRFVSSLCFSSSKRWRIRSRSIKHLQSARSLFPQYQMNAMAATPDFIDFIQLLLDQMYPSAVPTSSNVQFQPPHAFFPETPTESSSTQALYDVPQGTTQNPSLPLQTTLNSLTVQPQIPTVSLDGMVTVFAPVCVRPAVLKFPVS